LIGHAWSRLLWRRRRRWSIKGWTLLSKVATKLRVKPHVSGARIGSKWMRQIEVLIVGISLLKWSRRVALSFLGARRGMSHVWVMSRLHFLHILLQLLSGFFSPHVTLSQWHGETDTCQTRAQTTS
jgi:hypothetical protein